MSINVDEHPSRGGLKKRWKDCVKNDIRIKKMSMKMKSDRRKHIVPTPFSGIRRR
jgi:hypothetical protein